MQKLDEMHFILTFNNSLSTNKYTNRNRYNTETTEIHLYNNTKIRAYNKR